MLVYANSFLLAPKGGLNDIIKQIALWVGTPRKVYVDPQRLGTGIRDLRFSDGASLSSSVTLDDDGNANFPYYFNATLTHGQPGVPGRRWVTEIGIKQNVFDEDIHCSVLLRTDEISAKVTQAVQVTRPRIVEFLLDRCQPSRHTPGLSVISLTEQNATAFGYDIEHERRRHPIVEISCDREGVFPVIPERLRSVLVGLAQVIEITPQADTYEIENLLGRKYSAFGGAINIISPYRVTDGGGFCKTVLFKPEQIAELIEAGVAIESEILAVVTHQTNLPHSWRHISNDNVREAILRARLKKATADARGSPDLAAFEELLQEAADRLAAKDRDLNNARMDIEQRDDSLERVAAENENLKYHLNLSQNKADGSTTSNEEIPANYIAALKAIFDNNPSLEQTLLIIGAFYSKRIVILDTAISSAKDSDHCGFQHGAKAFSMLRTLADGYWSDLNDGKGDQQAKGRFGKNAFAAKEAETLSADGRRRRTFKFRDKDIPMEKHIKLGVKDSYAETLRVHFEWLPEERLIVIGHCGKHLDF